jgi:cytochrome P450/NADPH-cytochrome P450 reductase
MAMHTTIPQPKTYGALGNLPLLDTQKPVQSIVRIAEEMGPIFRLELPGRKLILIWGYELVAEACDESRFEKHISKALQYVTPIGGDGLFTSETSNPNWQKAHNILLPSFSQSAMRGYHDMMVDIAMQLVQKWLRFNPDDTVDVTEDMTRLTLDTIGLCGFNYRFNSFYREQSHPFVQHMVSALGESMNKLNRPAVQDMFMISAKRRMERNLEEMFRLVDHLIAERRAHPEMNGGDLMSHMLEGKDPTTGEMLSDENIRYQINTFLIAGHETTSGLLSFALFYLMKNREMMDMAYAEVDRVLTTPVPTYSQVRELKYVRMVLNETLRLWPTAPAFSLKAKEDTMLDGKYFFEKGSSVMVLIPNLHRDRSVWGDDVDQFRPERFANPSHIPQHAYKPFGNGVRACIGQQFALQEATLVLGLLLKHFEFVDSLHYELDVKETLTLKPDHFHITVRTRGGREAVSFMSGNSSANSESAGETRLAVGANAQGTPLYILFGSNMGTAEGIARKLGDQARKLGFQSAVMSMDQAIEHFPTGNTVIIISASYNGRPPANARKFMKWLDQVEDGSLQGLRYAVFGCGDRNWPDTYQSIPETIDRELAAKAATRMSAIGAADASGEFEPMLDAWFERIWPDVFAALGLEYAQDVSSEHSALTIELAADVPQSSGAVRRNDRDTVEKVLQRFGLERDTWIVVSGDPMKHGHLPIGQTIRAQDLLAEYVDLQAIATSPQLRELASYTVCPPHRDELTALSESKSMGKLSLTDLILKYEACELPFARFVELLPPLRIGSVS